MEKQLILSKRKSVFRFGLRLLLSLLLAFSLGFAWFADQRSKQKMENEFLRQVALIDEGIDPMLRASITFTSPRSSLVGNRWFGKYCVPGFDYQFASGLESIGDPMQIQISSANRIVRKAPGPDWIKSMFGENVFARIEVLFLSDDVHWKQLDFSNLSALRWVNLSRSRSTDLQEVGAVKGLNDVEVLEISDNYGLSSLEGIEQFKKLKKLNIVAPPSLNGIEPIRGMLRLEQFELFFKSAPWSSVTNYDLERTIDWSPLASLTGLRTLRLGDFQGTDLLLMKGMSNLETLELRARKLKSLNGIQQLKKLRELTIHWSPMLNDLSPIQEFEKLEVLKMRTRKLKSLEFVSRCPQLRSLDLQAPIQSLDGVEKLTKLESLAINGGTLESLHGLKGNKVLSRLDVSDCKNLKEVQALLSLSNLETFRWHGCDSLRDEQLSRLAAKFPGATFNPSLKASAK